MIFLLDPILEGVSGVSGEDICAIFVGNVFNISTTCQ